MINKRFCALMQVVGAYILCELSRFIRVNYLFGHLGYFSGINLVGPLMGTTTMTAVGLSLFLIRKLVSMSLTGTGFLTPLSYHIPTLFASAYWASPSKLIRLYVPLVCMALFVLHPVGSQAPLYVLYWLIPVVLSLYVHENTFTKALGSTFVAHAVGSVLWIYTLPTIPAYWYALIPLVAVERLLLCTGMVILHAVGGYAMKHLEKFVGRVAMAPISQTVN